MKRLLLVLALVACTGTTEPSPLTVAGYYQLLSIDGQPIPATISGYTTSGGGLTIALDSGWTVGDTTSAPFPVLFKWGGVVEVSGSSYVFKDSARAGVRYTGTIAGDIFTLTSSRTYRYQRKP
jgi:hypothetical protein